MKNFWQTLSVLGIKPDMNPFERRATTLVNRISMLSISIFLLVGIIPSLLQQDLLGIVVSAINLGAFCLILFMNYKGLNMWSRHFIMWFGLGMVVMVNMFFDQLSFQQASLLSMVIIPVMVFQSRKTIYVYYFLAVAAFVFIWYYQTNFEPLFILNDTMMVINRLINLVINIYIIGFALVMFFKGLQEEYQQKLEENNLLLAKQKEEISQQHLQLQETHAQLQQAQLHLVQSEKMASLGQLTAGIAHEINNPINFVSGSISPMRKDCSELKTAIERVKELVGGPSQDKLLRQQIHQVFQEEALDDNFSEMESLLDGIEEGAQRTSKIVAGLRSFSRLDEGSWKQIDLHEGLDATVGLLQHRMKGKIRLKCDYEDIPPVFCLPGDINQVFYHILINAIEAIEEEGEILIQTRMEQRRVQITIRDSGPGIPSALQEKIFDPFFTTKAVGKGTGLGLSIAFGIIQHHKGPHKGLERRR